MAIDPRKQLTDNGTVIGYDPKLNYNTETRGGESPLSSSNQGYDGDNGRERYTKLLGNFVKSAPSTSINKLDNLVEKVRKKNEELSKYFVPTRNNKYNDINLLLASYDADNTEYIDEFTSYYRYDISSGTIIPEIMTEIYYASKRIQRVSDTCKKLIYGSSDLSIEDIAKIDAASINKLMEYEKKGEISHVNYFALKYDTYMSRELGWYAGNISSEIDGLSILASRAPKEYDYGDVTKHSYVSMMFSEVNDELDYMRSSYNTHQSLEILDKTLYNYYNKRKRMLDLFDLSSDTGNITAIKFRNKAIDDVPNALSNVARTFMGCQDYLSEISKYEAEKKDLMSLYKGLSIIS